MSFDSLLIHRAKVRTMTPGTEDRYGNTPLGHDAGADVTVPARFDAIEETEDVIDRELQRERWRVFLGPEAVVDGTSELEWLDAGIVVRAEGGPRARYDSIGLHHYELTAYRVTG